ncbi:hypothetical protein ACFE04_007233 [Oxalis oulophora]
MDLPFEVGNLVEMRSFDTGFRGAWFRCKVLDTRIKNHWPSLLLEYCDYPDEKIVWIEVYQNGTRKRGRKPKVDKKELMVRPSFPRAYRQSQLPDSISLTEELIVVPDSWQVGDLVDWFYDDCYWSGTVTAVLGGEKVKIELPSPPIGEGSIYEALCKDLRPSLKWSPDGGWTVPVPSAMGFVVPAPEEGRKRCNLTSGVPNDDELLPPERSEEQPLTEEKSQKVLNTQTVLVAGDCCHYVVPAPRERQMQHNTTTGASNDDKLPPHEPSEGRPFAQSLSINAPNETPTPVMQEITEGEPLERIFKTTAPNETATPVMEAIAEGEIETSLGPSATPVMEAIAEGKVETSLGPSAGFILQPLHVSEGSLLKRPSVAAGGDKSIKKRNVGEGRPFAQSLSINALNETPTPVKQKITEGEPLDEILKTNAPNETATVVKQEMTEGEPLERIFKTTPNETATPVMETIVEGKVETSLGPSGSFILQPLHVSEGSLLIRPSAAAGGDESIKKRNVSEDIPDIGIRPDTLEAAIVDLERLLMHVRWAMRLLKDGVPSNTARPSWKFVEYRGPSSSPK